jgi:hypothetical protein
MGCFQARTKHSIPTVDHLRLSPGERFERSDIDLTPKVDQESYMRVVGDRRALKRELYSEAYLGKLHN